MTNSEPSLLSKPYERKIFLEFLKNQFLTNGFSQGIEDLDCEVIDNIKTFKTVTKIGWDESLDLEIIEIEHEKDSDPRISLTKGIHRLMSYYGYESSLVVFKAPGSDKWRLSLVTQEYEVKLTGKVARKYSNPKRYSFALGKDITIKTAQQHLMKGKVQGVADLQSRFSVEALNKEFYKQIKEQYDNLCQQIQLPNPNMDSQEVENNRKDFALRLIGRLIFCWFLRAKSWITEDVLSSQAVNNYNNLGGYYHSVLELLFFDTLNQAVENRATDIQDSLKNALKKIPYLNGGLFEPKESDYFDKSQLEFSDRINHQLKIPDEIIKSILGLFEEYHFTVDESTSSDQEIGIDPEMMGKVFENFILDRSAKGAFYTPREIVDYMVSSSLVENLKTKFTVLPQTKEQVLEWVNMKDIELQKQIKGKPNAKVIINNSVFLNKISVSAYLVAKLRGQVFDFKTHDFDKCNPHSEINLEIWQDLLNGNFEITHRFIPNPNISNVKNLSFTVPKVGYIIKINSQQLVCFFTILFNDTLQLDTFYRIYDEKKIAKLCGKNSVKALRILINYTHSQGLSEQSILKLLEVYIDKRNTSQLLELSKTSLMDPWLHILTSLADPGFSALRETYKLILPNNPNIVKSIFGSDQVLGYIKEVTDNSFFSSSNQTISNIITHLSSIKVFDPACGSGAFPMGILQKLTEIIHTLDETQSIYNIKKSILENCIYGVDIMPIAVEISRLRCWLSLLVDEVTPEPLPNLEFKFVCANSLIGITKEPKQSIDTRLEDLEADLENLRKETFRPQQSKIDLSKKWVKITNELYRLQIETGFYKSKDASTDLTSWNPFENKPASFFDPE